MTTSTGLLFKNGRFWLSGPATLLVSLLVMLAMAAWFPPGAGNVNNIVMPLVMFPLIWAALFFYTYLANDMRKAWGLLLALFIVNSVVLAFQFLG
ncbi:hypothetical protein CA267_014730 [Alteromonas pelagimontana]|uniref:Uncharacterized protein n=1 Tax=Alteromonas pelagimontana TaxID=1858656 RepID=A0A6M4MH56_9ALTE|nr:hypothetical protein [Alteromonas pelagimontana]QJR81920.1 hypothetical protein CA267_014730 [Alteromonas pelagimontana]